jgi:RND family efflux transporter MFP subunit
MIYSLNSAQNDRAQTLQQINNLQNQINNPQPIPTASSSNPTPSANPSSDLQQQLTKLQTTLDTQTKSINDLYNSIDKAKSGLNTTINTSQLGSNQILAQIQSSQNQSKVLDLNLNSTKTKLGYTGDSSDALQLAQEAYNSTSVQLNTALDNAENQVKLAQLNYDLAQNSASGLMIKAPFSGLISSLDLSPGQQVNPQASIVEIINPQAYELEINIDPAIADRLNLNESAEVELAGRTLEVPIKSVAPVVNSTTHLVTVRLTLPPITFKANQTLNAQLPLSTTQIQSGESGGTSTTFLPLDAVIIGTESQFVYVNDNGKAKKVDVQLGQISGDQVQILSGLSPSDQVILQGAKDLSDGQPIQVK